MADDVPEWQMMWGAKVKMPNDMPDDVLKDSIRITNAAIQAFPDFDTDGLKIAEQVKKELDARWSPNWHVIIGRNFGSFVTHETRTFLFFYLGDKAVMIYKAG